MSAERIGFIVQHRMPACQLPRAKRGDSPQKSRTVGGTQCLHITPASQWLDTTTGRVAPDAYSWMQSVHWVGGSGLYTPTQTHGPKWGPTTLLIAQEISALKECRPSVDYLARKLRLSVRTVKYHLAMLREAGLLVYRSKGTRLAGRINQASVYERVIPVEFDQALGIRTIQRDETAPAHTRVPVGIAETGRKLIGKLAKKAARKVRRPRRRTTPGTPVSGRTRCTPMQGGTSGLSSTGSSIPPSENKLASGSTKSPTPKKPNRAPRTLNKVGRRYQLARQLTDQVPWLRNAAVARIAWVIRHVADAGWTVQDVRAWLDLTTEPSPLRPSALLAYRLKGAVALWATPEQRYRAVTAWEDDRRLEHARHEGWDWQGGAATAAARLQELAADATIAAVDPAGCWEVSADESGISIEDLPRETVVELRVEAEKSPSLILDALDCGMTETDARRLYTNRLVDQALKSFSPAASIHTYA